MSALDQAFIKAYTQHIEASTTLPNSADPVSPTSPPEDRPPGESADAPTRVSIDGLLRTMQRTSTGVVDPVPPKQTPQPVQQGSGCGPGIAELPQAVKVGTSALVGTGCLGLEKEGAELAPTLEDLGLHGIVSCGEQGASTKPVERPFRPMLQVDNLAWPAVCRRLGEAAPGQLGRLTEGLWNVMARRRKVVAIGGCRCGEGATTMLLCVGRCLAQRGLKVVLADAHLADPQLARRLGLLPQSGWEDVLAGRLPLEEVVIESAGDDLAVLPVREAFAGTDAAKEDETRLADSIQRLAAHYDLVLVDLGPLEDLATVGGRLARGIGSRLEALVLVHDVRVTPWEDLVEIQRSLAATDILQAGIVENFVHN